LFPVPDTFPIITIITHLDFINCVIFGEQYKSLCTFLQIFFSSSSWAQVSS
jgi:hypothetical protein